MANLDREGPGNPGWQSRKVDEAAEGQPTYEESAPPAALNKITKLGIQSTEAVQALPNKDPGGVAMLLHGYSIAIERSRALGQPVNFLVEVSPDGLVALTPIAEGTVASEHGDPESRASDFSRSDPLAAARERGRLRAAEILAGEEMVSADVFATLLGTTRVTVNTKRQGGLLLGLDGAKRGFRFPLWQLDADGVPYAQISALHERLGGPWAVYRFLMQPHGELGGLTGLEALKRGKSLAVIDAAESVTRGSH